MPKKIVRLYRYFQPGSYEVDLKAGQVKITGKKLPPPSKRITLHQKDLKITDAKIVRHDKRGDQEFTIARINHLPAFEQVRLHTRETLFPGNYEVEISFIAKKPGESRRSQFPCIDELEAWAQAKILD